jgi:N-acylneuraminate cytidylyltransferase
MKPGGRSHGYQRRRGRTIAIIPARGGSKGIPRKNLALLGGVPLICWSLAAARDSSLVDQTVVSTDDHEIAELAADWGASIHERSARLSDDRAHVMDCVRDVLSSELLSDECEVGLLLEPTSPLRSATEVEGCVQSVLSGDFDSAATFAQARLNPHRAFRLQDGTPRPFLEGADPWRPRQALPDAWQLSGNAYAFRIDALPSGGQSFLFGRTKAVLSEAWRLVDIDDPFDLEVADAIVGSRGITPPVRTVQPRR